MPDAATSVCRVRASKTFPVGKVILLRAKVMHFVGQFWTILQGIECYQWLSYDRSARISIWMRPNQQLRGHGAWATPHPPALSTHPLPENGGNSGGSINLVLPR